MTAAMLVLEPIFEADLPPDQYAYRAGRNAQQAVVEVDRQPLRGHPEVVDADLADYFGSIPQAELMKRVARRIVDRRVLHLVRMWLDCPVEETDDRGRRKRMTEARNRRRGVPQGSPISPLLANIYMRRFVLGSKKLGLERSLGTRIVTHADDLEILCRKGKAEEALRRLCEIMSTATIPEQKPQQFQRVAEVCFIRRMAPNKINDLGRRFKSPATNSDASPVSQNAPRLTLGLPPGPNMHAVWSGAIR